MDSNPSQLEPQHKTDHRIPLQPSPPIHSHYRPTPSPPMGGFDNYAEFDAVPRQSAPAPVTPPPTPVMFPGQTMVFIFFLMVAATFWGSALFYLVLKFLHLVY
jgi:hypothetical protein